MGRTVARLETAANVSIVVLCLCVCGDLAYRYLLRPTERLQATAVQPPPPRIQEYKPGDRVDGLPSVDFQKSPRTLLLVVRSGCHYCRDSMPFYRILASTSRAQLKGLRLIGVCTEGKEACTRFLRDENVELDDTVAVRPGVLRVRGTPTLVLVDASAKVIRMWTGQLQEDKQREVLGILGNAHDGSPD